MTSRLKRAITSLAKRRWTPKLGFGRAAAAAQYPLPVSSVPPFIPPLGDLSKIDGRNCGYHNDLLDGWFNGPAGEIAAGFKVTAEDTVVDVGCGEGGICGFAANIGAEVIATDIDAGCVERVARRLSQTKARAHRAIVSDSNPLPLADGIATRVISLEVLEHVPDPAQFMAELVRIGKPGALYLLAVPDDKAEWIQKKIAPPAYWGPPNHVRIFSRPDFARTVENAGLTIESRAYKSFYWAIWWMLFWAAGHDYTEKEGPLLYHWTQTWLHLMNTPNGNHVRAALDEFMPKSQVIVARKPL